MHSILAPEPAAAVSTELPLVTIVIAAYNRVNDVLRNVQRLRRTGYPNVEIIVADDGSTDGTAAALADLPHVKVIALAENAGPGRARNAAVAAARGKYIFFLDSDAFLSRRTLRRLVRFMEDHPSVGIAGCRIVNDATRDIDQWLYAQQPDSHARQTFETYSFTAAGAMARTDVLRGVGGFWEDLRIYNEELDLSIRVMQSGQGIVYYPDAYVFHRTPPRHRAGPRYWRLQTRNRIWICYRHYPMPLCLAKIAFYAGLSLAKGALNRRLLSCLSGLWDGVRRFDLYRRFPRKLSRQERSRLAELNRRRRIWWGQ